MLCSFTYEYIMNRCVWVVQLRPPTFSLNIICMIYVNVYKCIFIAHKNEYLYWNTKKQSVGSTMELKKSFFFLHLRVHYAVINYQTNWFFFYLFHFALSSMLEIKKITITIHHLCPPALSFLFSFFYMKYSCEIEFLFCTKNKT